MNVSLKQESAGGFVNRAVLFLLVHMTNAHGKRILFLASLYCRVVRLDEMREEALGKLNALLNLAKRDTAMRMPWAMRDIIWSNGDALSSLINAEMEVTDPAVRDAKLRSLSKQIVEGSAPKWRYADTETMVLDVHDMMADIFKERQDIPSAAQLAAA